MVGKLEYSRVGCKQQLGEADFKEFLVQLSADRDFGSTACFARSELNRKANDQVVIFRAELDLRISMKQYPPLVTNGREGLGSWLLTACQSQCCCMTVVRPLSHL